MKFIRKNKKIFLPILIVFIVALIFVLLYSNFIYQDGDSSEKKEDATSKYVVIDSSSPPLDSSQGTTNEDVVDGKNFKLDKDGNKINSGSLLAKKHEINGFIVTDLYITSSINSPDYAVLMFNIENTSDVKSNFGLFFKFKNEEGTITDSLAVYFPSLEKNVVTKYSSETYYPVIDAYDYELEYIIFE